MPKMPKKHRSGVNPRLLRTALQREKLKPIVVDKKGDHYGIETMKPGHVDEKMCRWLADPQVMGGLNSPTIQMPIEAFKAYVDSFDNIRKSLIRIYELESGDSVGLIVLEIEVAHRLGSIHLVIGEGSHRGRRAGIEIGRLITHHAMLDRKVEKLLFQPLASNAPAVALCESFNLRLEGRFEEHRIDPVSGDRVDQLQYALSQEEMIKRIEARGETVKPVFRRKPAQDD